MKAQLLFNAPAKHVVWLTQGPVRIDPDFRDHEKGYAPHPFGGPLDSGEQEMDDVFSQVVVAPGNEYLGALDLEVIPLPIGGGSQGGQV